MEPHCTSGSYCYEQNECSLSACTSATSCTASQVFCPTSNTCPTDDAVMNDNCAVSNRYTGTTTPHYRVKYVNTYNIPSTGHNVIPINVTTQISVSKGDIIGYYNNPTGAKIATRDLLTGEIDDKSFSVTLPVTANTDLTNVHVAENVRHLVRAIAVKPATVLLFHTYTAAGTYTLSATADNDYITGSATGNTNIVVMVGIDRAVINNVQYVATGQAATVHLLPHTGRV